MLSPDQITAIAPDAASLKAGRDLGSPRKWESLGGDPEVLWGLAMGSGKVPYQTRVRLGDLATKCSCPSRKFPCKHALGLMFLASGQPAALTQTERPAWVTEWIDAHAARGEKAAARTAAEKESGPVDEKAAAKRRARKESRVNEGVQLLQRSIIDLTREGLASGSARDPGVWTNLAKRMVDSQVPGLAGTLHHVADTVLNHPDVDRELPWELGRLHLLLKTFSSGATGGDPLHQEIRNQLGIRSSADDNGEEGKLEDQWFVASRQVSERDRLVTSSSWLLGKKTRRWGKVLRFAPVMQAIIDPWPLGSTVHATLQFQAGLSAVRAIPEGDGKITPEAIPGVHEEGFDALLSRFSAALAINPFSRAVPFFISLCPTADGRLLLDAAGMALPWRVPGDGAFQVDCICAGNLTPACGEWDGRSITLLSIQDGEVWHSLSHWHA